MPTLCACRYLHKLIKLLDMNITAFRLQEQMYGLGMARILLFTEAEINM